jgi:hypothetical protein
MAAPAWGLLCPRHGRSSVERDTTGRLRPRTPAYPGSSGTHPPCVHGAMTRTPPPPHAARARRAHGTFPTPLAPLMPAAGMARRAPGWGGRGGGSRSWRRALCIWVPSPPRTPTTFQPLCHFRTSLVLCKMVVPGGEPRDAGLIGGPPPSWLIWEREVAYG